MPKAHYPVPSVKPTVYGCPQVGEKKTNILTFIYFSALFSSFRFSFIDPTEGDSFAYPVHNHTNKLRSVKGGKIKLNEGQINSNEIDK